MLTTGVDGKIFVNPKWSLLAALLPQVHKLQRPGHHGVYTSFMSFSELRTISDPTLNLVVKKATEVVFTPLFVRSCEMPKRSCCHTFCDSPSNAHGRPYVHYGANNAWAPFAIAPVFVSILFIAMMMFGAAVTSSISNKNESAQQTMLAAVESQNINNKAGIEYLEALKAQEQPDKDSNQVLTVFVLAVLGLGITCSAGVTFCGVQSKNRVVPTHRLTLLDISLLIKLQDALDRQEAAASEVGDLLHGVLPGRAGQVLFSSAQLLVEADSVRVRSLALQDDQALAIADAARSEVRARVETETAEANKIKTLALELAKQPVFVSKVDAGRADALAAAVHTATAERMMSAQLTPGAQAEQILSIIVPPTLPSPPEPVLTFLEQKTQQSRQYGQKILDAYRDGSYKSKYKLSGKK